ncbi:transcriptional regulator [Dinoroseobacter shibae DFL 12 = DSM 16493]|jgi:DnaK suppressor protein|uniref:Transcriptional regulator n=1 Tax=Dinoroseobacter shibae (strain DSM 16493 / NCIMB 14021 / DFL 12) TaxID=398580 RepID=A8LJD1_DINSH|nr:transcriptional regulator [Dinoroseobacter shibae]ABV93153.1 transcriptional regulator [Dinoroseobacter shibae DFL 12 = DSM 16493]URF48078.1 hypothetical protein M8008_07280 [Dinoroseobacter shibae]URF52388.1 hypothetical protein M8007_07280 [Dinoroseobacter shibae]
MDLLERQTELRAERRALIETLRRGRPGAVTRPGRRAEAGSPELRQLRRLELALKRIETGAYGLCMACGGEISPGRLHACPATALCASCKGEG